MKELTYLKEKLSGHSLIILKDDTELISDERGIRPLLAHIRSGEDLRGAYAADRIVGKAAAMLYVLLRVRAVYADVMSKSAREIFDKYGIHYEYETLTENIVNRSGDDLCPMEKTVMDIAAPEDALAALKAKAAAMKGTVTG